MLEKINEHKDDYVDLKNVLKIEYINEEFDQVL